MSEKTSKQSIDSKILSFCKNDFKSLSEIADHLNMNKNTVRAHYLYRLRKEGKLEVPKSAVRSGMKYLKK
jgi:predicted ArsR family transcriptional regulator